MDPTLRRKLILNLDYVPETKSRGVGRNGGGGGGSRVFSSHIGGSRSTAFRQTIGADDTEGTNRGSKKRKQPASTDDDEEEEEEEQALERRQPILTSREQPAGIDVGMSGSGLSSVPARTDPALVTAEMDWPGLTGKAEKVPSVVALAEDNPDHQDFPSRDVNYFGFKVPDGAACRSFFKATLDENVHATDYDDEILSHEIVQKLVNIQDPEKNKSTMVLAMKHLRELQLEKATRSIGEHEVEALNFVYVFTYPAACSKRGQEKLREAAIEAGFTDRQGDKIKLISEAHAAAMAAFVGSKMQHGPVAWREYFKKSSLVTIVDIGALTCDLTTVCIKSNDPKLRIEEEFVSVGGRCGTTAIYCRVYVKLADKFGAAFTDLPESTLDRRSVFFEACERVVKTFDGEDLCRNHRLPLTLASEIGHPDYKPDTKEVTISSQEIKEAIDGTVEYMEALLRNQFAQQGKGKFVQTTVLCGGGSLNSYIFNKLVRFCRDNGNIRAIRAKDPESTVCRGAVISQLSEDFFGIRLSRANYGIEVQKQGRQYVYWFISRGERLSTKKVNVVKRIEGGVYVSIKELYDISQKTARLQIPIYIFDRDNQPPERPKTNDPGVECIATIVMDWNSFSMNFTKTLRKKMERESTTMEALELSISLAVNQQGRLYFEARSGTSGRIVVGKGELRFDATEKSRDP